MRSPSNRVLDNTCNIFLAPPGRGADGGVVFNFPPQPNYPNEPCSTQPVATEEVTGDDQKRIGQLTTWLIMFRRFINANPRDMITFYDKAGVLHQVTVMAERDNAGRGSAYSLYASERT